jgi:hypothetical protein
VALLRVRRAELRRDDALQQVGLVVGPAPEGGQVPRCDPVACETGACPGDVDVALGEALLAVLAPRLDQAELLQLMDEGRVHARALAQRGKVDLVLGRPQAGGAGALPLARGAGRELLPDHP